MRFYSFNKPNQWATWSKYLEEYDSELNGFIQYKDITNPNYLILNYSYLNKTEQLTQPFYSDAELETNILDIKHTETIKEYDDTTNPPTQISVSRTVIYAHKLNPHQGILNTYGTAYIRYKNIPQPGDLDYESDVNYDDTVDPKSGLYTFKQGFVIISRALTDAEKSNPDCYLYHAMGASGTYYIPQGWSPTSTWIYTPNATDKYGVKTIFTIANNGTRWYNKTGDTTKYYLKDISDTSSSITVLNNLTTQQIVSRQNSWWCVQYILGTELYQYNNNEYEEVICDEVSSSYVHVNEAGESLHYHRIDTNIPTGRLSNLYINYY